MEFNKSYNRQEFVKFLQNNFLPEDFIPETEQVDFTTQMKYTTEAVKLGSSATLDLVVYEIKHTSRHDARVSLSKEAFRMLADEMEDRALVIFVPEDCNDRYRFSFIEITLDIAEGSSKVTHNYSNPRRYSYLLGKGIAYYTPNKYLNEKGRVVNDEDLHSRFSVEVLTKEFYNELSDWYAWAIQIIRFPNDINDDTDDAKYNNEGAIRLITRLIFVWFLKQRHLIPEEFFDESYIANNLLNDFTPNLQSGLFAQKSYESKYYKAILQNLFFAMLNSPINAEGSVELSERHFRNGSNDYDNNKLMRYEDYFSNPELFVDLANKTVPFLNGGLFDCLDDKDNGMYYDGFSDCELVRKSLAVPDFLFFGEEVGKNIDLSEWYGDAKKKKVSSRGIIDILKRYNFTVEENTPFDQEVSLDPELLGKVFENLLASYNPETQTTARKQTGSFYTPREIVQYMVDESLIAHLKRTVGEELEPKFRQLVEYTDEPIDFTDDQRKLIMQSLYECKILDPACGSGAYPMGILQQMVHILGRIDPDNAQWKAMMMDQAINETTEAFKNASSEERIELISDIERSFDEGVNRPDYARKLYLIENCIYGVDIQPIAIQISKLRFFISLVVDQKTNNDPLDNFGIRPLPNLEAKFVAANTLIGLNKKEANLFDSDAIKAKEEEMKIAKHKIFASKYKTKRKWRNKVDELRLDIANMLKDCGAVGNVEAQQLASWDMFDQNASSPFFDPEWMFGVKDGFNLIVGNPPFIGSKGNEAIFHEVCHTKKGRDYFSRWMDYFYYFFHFGIESLSENGILSFITTNYYYTATGADKLRKHFKKYHVDKIVDFGEVKLFQSALGQHNAITFIHKEHSEADITKIIKIEGKGLKMNIDVELLLKGIGDVSVYNIKTTYLYSGSDNQMTINIQFSDSTESSLINKLIKNSIPCGDLAFITMGIVTLSDTISNKHLLEYNLPDVKKGDGIYVLSNEEFINLGLDDQGIRYIKPFYKNSDINKYYTPHITSKWLIYIKDKGTPIHLPIQLQKHFERFRPLIIGLKENFLKNEIAANVVLKWLNNGNYFVLFTPKKEEYFTSEKIIAPYRAKTNIFAYSDEAYFASKDVAYIIPKNTLCKIKYLLAILNSKLIFYWLKIKGKNKGDILELYAKPLSEIPIKISDHQDVYIKIIDEILQCKQNKKLSTTHLEEKIDLMVYKLYNLTFDEVKIVDPGTPITKEEYEAMGN